MVDIPDGLPKWSGMNKTSELIADSPAEAVRKRKREIEEEKTGEGASEKNGKSKSQKKD